MPKFLDDIIASGGSKVGIGTESPSQKLHVDGKIRANSWFQGADGTNTLWANASEGVLIETPGSTSGNNDSKIYFRNSGNTVKHTFDTNNGNATFTGNVTAPNLIASTAVYAGGVIYAGGNTLSLKKSNGNSYVDFDTNLNATFAGDILVNTATAGGYIQIDQSDDSLKLADANKLKLGTGNDLQIYHDGSNNYIQASGTGDIIIEQRNDDKDIVFNCDDGSGGIATYFRLDGSAGGSDPVTRWPDGSRIQLGTSGDADLYHDGTDTYFYNSTGDLKIINYADDKDVIFMSDNGSGGVETYFYLDGGNNNIKFVRDTNWIDNEKATFGSSGDLQILHNATNSYIQNYLGDLYINNWADNKDIIFQSDDGSGGVTPYITLDGSHTKTIMGKTVHFDDNVKIQMGSYASPDLQIYHDGSNSYIDETGTGDLVLNTNGASIKLLFNGSEFMGQFVANGSARLYYDNAQKLETTSGGVDITGELEATSLDINGVADISGDLTLANSNKIVLNGGMNTAGNFDAAKIRLNSSNTVDTTGFHGIRFATSSSDNYGWSFGANRSSSGRGSLRFYEHNNANAGTERFTLLQDGNVGIGNANPTSAKLVIREDSSYGLRLEDAAGHYFRVNTGGDTEVRGNITFGDGHTIGDDADDNLLIQGSSSENVIIRSEDGLYFRTGGDNTRLTINSSGAATFAGDINLADSKALKLGASSDLQLYHDGTNNYIDSSTGHLYIRNTAQDKDIVIQGNDGGSTVTALEFDMSAGAAATFAGNVTLDPSANSDVSIHMHANSGALGDAYAWNLIAESSADNYEFTIAQGTTDVLKFNNTAAAGDNNATFAGAVTAGGKVRINATTTTGLEIASSSGATSGLKLFNNSNTDAASIINHYNGDLLIGTNNATVLTMNGTTSSFAGNIQTSGDIVIGAELMHNGDTDTKLRFDTDQIRLYTSGTEAFEIDSSQNATFTGNITTTGGDSVAPQINILHDGTNPGANEELGVIQFQVDYDGSHQDWGKIRLDTNASSVRTNMEFYVKSTSGSEQVALTLEGQPSAVPNATFAGTLDVNGAEITVGTNGSIFAENNVRFKSSGAAYIDHNTTSQSIKFRLSSSSSLDVIPLEITPTYMVSTTDMYFGDSDKIRLGGSSDLQMYHDGTDNHIDATSTLNIATGTSGVAVKIGHTTSEVLIADNLTVDGNLTTKGDFIIQNTSNVAIKDTIITLNDGTSGTAGTDSNDIGIMFERHGNNKFMGWDEDESYFILAENTQDVSVAVTGLTYGTLQTLRANVHVDTLSVGSENPAQINAILDEDNMSSNSATSLATQQSIKAYADTKLPLAGGTITGNVKFGDNVELRLGSGADLKAYHSGTHTYFDNNVGDLFFRNLASDKDIKFTGNDGGSTITALELDMSDSGKAYFNSEVHIGGLLKIPSLVYHINDLDTYFGFTANDTFKVITGGTEALEIDSSQNATFAGGVGSDGLAKSYTWALPSTGADNNLWYKIARVTGTQSQRFKLQMVGGYSFSDNHFASEVNVYGQLNNDNNYDLIFHQLEKFDQTSSPVLGFGQVDVDTTSTDLYVKMANYSELAITASVSKGDIYPEATSTGSASEPTNFVAATEQFSVLSNANFAGDVSASGDVGIGTNTPGYKLHVNGGGLQTTTATGNRIAYYDGSGINAYGGSSGYAVNNYNGNLTFTQHTDDGDIIFQSDNGSGGTETYFFLDGSLSSGNPRTIFPDNSRLGFGSSGDTYLEHDGSNGYLGNSTGHLYIRQNTDDKDIVFQSDDGSGGLAEYFRLDGSSVINVFNKQVYLPDNIIATFGDGSDLSIHHNGSNSYITQQGTGDLYLTNTTDDKDIIFQSDNGAGGVQTYFFLDGSAERVEFNKSALWTDNDQALFGSGGDLKIWHDGTDSVIQNDTGDLELQNRQDDGDIVFKSDDGSGGVAEYFRLDGSAVETYFSKTILFFDDVVAKFGDGSDLRIQHASGGGGASFIQNYTGDLNIQNLADDKDIVFKCDDGSGGVAEYFRLDGSEGYNIASKHIMLEDNVELRVGGGADLKIAHISGNNYITGTNGDLYIRNGSAADKDIIFQADNGSGGNAEYFRLDGGGELTFFSKHLQMADNVKMFAGDSGELQIFHDGTNSNIINAVGNLAIQNNADNGDIKFFSDDGSGGATEYITIDGSDEIVRVHKPLYLTEYIVHIGDDNTKFGFSAADTFVVHAGATGHAELTIDSTSATFAGDVNLSNSNGSFIYLNTNTGAADTGLFLTEGSTANKDQNGFKIYYSGSGNTLKIDSGTSSLTNRASIARDTGEVTFTGDVTLSSTAPIFYLDNTTSSTGKKWRLSSAANGKMYITQDGVIDAITLEHTTGNATFAGHVTITGGSDIFLADNGKTHYGVSNDLEVYHDGSNSYVLAKGTGDLILEQQTNDKDILFKSDDGSGGVTEYFRLDGGQTQSIFSQNAQFQDNVRCKFGTAADLQIFHDGNNSYINEVGSGSLVLQSSDLFLRTNTSENAIVCAANASVTLYYDNAAKLATAAAGVNTYYSETANTDGTHAGDVVNFGETTTVAGKIYYYTSSGAWELADADAESTAKGMLAVALGTSSSTHGMLIRGMVTLDHDPGTIADTLFLSTAAGAATATAPSGTGDIVRVIGYCLNSTNGQIYFNPDGAFVEVA